MKGKNKYFHLYLFFIEFLGALCFYCGFFPASTSSNKFSTMGELPDINNSKLDSFFAYKKHFDKCVIMVIDSLRYDFVDSNNSNIFFPYLSKQLNLKDSCLLKARVQSPTVTLPRIKSLLTGAVPGFLDVVSNFGKTELVSDNFIKQAKAGGYKTVFYGDETWINLLPHAFHRSEGTISFFVSDFSEVDLNVTRNVEIELSGRDWDLMVLHYLGLDHIGHLEGPRSKLIKPKLNEMDSVILKINENFLRTNEEVLIVICGDHGMKDSGGHGGTSLSEVLVPVAILNYECNPSLRKTEIGQIDIAPFLSILLGLPIPSDSIGKVHYKMLAGLDQHHALYALYYNALRLSKKSLQFLNDTTLDVDINNCITNGTKYFSKFLNSQSYIDYLNSAQYFTRLQEMLSEKLMSISVTYDVTLMAFGLILFLQSILASIFGNGFTTQVFTKNLFFIATIVTTFHYGCCKLSDSTSSTCFLNFSNIFITSILYTLMSVNLLFIQYSMKINLNLSPLKYFFVSATLLHVLSLTSSSYVEEEHQLCYFFAVTFCLFFIKSDIIGFSFILFCHRFLRCLNQTGDKWALLPDLEDWFTHNVIYLLFFYSFSLISTCIACKLIIYYMNPYLTNFFNVGQFLTIFLYKIISGTIKLSNVEPNQYFGVLIARSFWFISFLKSVFVLKSLKNIGKLPYNKRISRITDFLFEIIVVVIALLYKPHNLILIPSLLMYSYIIVRNFQNDTFSLIFLHYWLGMVFYFYQGNSNSISSIDVSPGYVGLASYNFYITGFFITLNTFSSPILAFLLMLRALAKLEKFVDGHPEILQFITIINGIHIIVYSVIMTIQRNHIFIWSVFAPKLLYSLSFIVLNALLILISLIIDFCCKAAFKTSFSQFA